MIFIYTIEEKVLRQKEVILSEQEKVHIVISQRCISWLLSISEMLGQGFRSHWANYFASHWGTFRLQ